MNRVGLVPVNTTMNGDIGGGSKLCLDAELATQPDTEELRKKER